MPIKIITSDVQVSISDVIKLCQTQLWELISSYPLKGCLATVDSLWYCNGNRINNNYMNND